MSNTLAWAAVLGVLLGLGWLATASVRPSATLGRVRGSGGTLSPGGNPVVGENPVSAKAHAVAVVASALMKADRVDEACEIVGTLNDQERGFACDYAFTKFINDRSDVFNDDPPVDDEQTKRLLEHIRWARKVAERSSDPDLRAIMLASLLRHRSRIPEGTAEPTKSALLQAAKQSLAEPSSNIPTGVPWYSVLLTGLYGAVTTAVGWKLLEAGSTEIGKWFVQNFVLPLKPEANTKDTPSDSNEAAPATPTST
jgi:hypothetical protein